MSLIRDLLTHPLHARSGEGPLETAELHARIIHDKEFLRRVYEDWYGRITRSLPNGAGAVLEIGSGPGFLCRFIPGLVTSDIVHHRSVRAVLDAHHLPFKTASLRAVVMTDVLHHLPEPRLFFSAAARCVRPEGRIVMIEPWFSVWSGFIYRHLHHELFEPKSETWEFPRRGEDDTANGALPWILFKRDVDQFRSEFPEWRTVSIQPFMPFSYLISGGLQTRRLMPGFLFSAWQRVEAAVSGSSGRLAMFAHIVLERSE